MLFTYSHTFYFFNIEIFFIFHIVRVNIINSIESIIHKSRIYIAQRILMFQNKRILRLINSDPRNTLSSYGCWERRVPRKDFLFFEFMCACALARRAVPPTHRAQYSTEREMVRMKLICFKFIMFVLWFLCSWSISAGDLKSCGRCRLFLAVQMN